MYTHIYTHLYAHFYYKNAISIYVFALHVDFEHQRGEINYQDSNKQVEDNKAVL